MWSLNYLNRVPVKGSIRATIRAIEGFSTPPKPYSIKSPTGPRL